MTILSISIVLYKSDIELFKKCIDSVCASVNNASVLIDKCIIDIVDNNGYDKKYISFSKILIDFAYLYTKNIIVVNYFRNTNIGYGASNNISIFNNSQSQFHLVINPDVILDINCISECINFMNYNYNISLITPKILDFDGNLQKLCKYHPTFNLMILKSSLFFSTFPVVKEFINKSYMNINYDLVNFDIEYASGCFMFFRMHTLSKFRGFDEIYFLHYEDADICRKLLLESTIAYNPKIIIKHKWTRSTHNTLLGKYHTIISGLKYIIKWKFKMFHKNIYRC